MNYRYSRQILFKDIAEAGQEKLQKAKVAIIGCGALGSHIAETLVRAGVGTIYLADRDYVESSNLQRQQLFTEQDAIDMKPKVIAATKRLLDIRSDVTIYTYFQHVDNALIEKLAKEVDLIMDGTDNFETRLLMNDAAYKYNIPWIYGACVGSSGVVFPFIPKQTPCFRCLLPALPSLNETCDTVGIISPAVHITASIQCAEALKILTGNIDAVRKKVHHFDCWNNAQMDVGVSKIRKEDCLTCSVQAIYPELQSSENSRFAVLCGRDAVQILPSKRRKLSLDEAELVAKKINATWKKTPYFVVIFKESYKIIVFQDGRMIIHGLQDINQGRKLYTELFG